MTKITLDIRGSLKNTKISSNKYVVLEKLISNSIDSFLIRREQEPSHFDLNIAVSIELFSTGLLGDQLDVSLSCTDNGCGFGDEQMKAFLTKDTSYKDDLSIAAIGKCKGAGRIQFFHHFEKVGVDSACRIRDRVVARTLSRIARREINLADFVEDTGNAAEIGTTITMESLKSGPREVFYTSEPLTQTFSAANVRRHMLVALLQRLVSLRAELGDFKISFKTSHGGTTEESELRDADLPAVSNVRQILVEEIDTHSGKPLGKFEKFQISHYKLDATQFGLRRNAISLCAKSSPVEDITARYLPTKTEQNQPIGGHHHIVLIEGELLDRCVNEQRDGFEGIPEEAPHE